MSPNDLKQKVIALRQRSTGWILNAIRIQTGLRSTRKLAEYLTQVLGMCQASTYEWLSGKTKAPKRAHRALVLLYFTLISDDPSRAVTPSEDPLSEELGEEVDFDTRRIRV